MSLPGGISDHEHPHREESGEMTANRVHQAAQGRNPFHHILLHEKDRLNRPYLAVMIF